MVMDLDLLKLLLTGKLTIDAKSLVQCKENCVPSRLLAEFGQLLDLRDPDSLSHKEREEQRKEKEAGEFNPDHYLAGVILYALYVSRLTTDY